MIYAALIVALAAVLIAVAYELQGNRLLRERTKRRVLVTTHDGRWFSGVLLTHDRRCLVLRDAQTEAEDGPAVVDGEVLILFGDVAHVQFP